MLLRPVRWWEGNCERPAEAELHCGHWLNSVLGVGQRRWRQAGGVQMEALADCQAGYCDAGVGFAGSVAVGLSSPHTSAAPYERTDGQQEAAASDIPTINKIYA